jgi:CubicO group peptidase (beta-lactamase class C family)
LAFALILLAGCGRALAADTSQTIAGLDRKAVADFAQDFARRTLGPDTTPALYVVVVDAAGHRYSAAFGEAGPGHRPARTDQPIRVASQTKLFTALAVLKLVDEGRISLDAPIEDYLEGYRLPRAHGLSRSIPGPTVRDLLRHSSGLSNIGMVGGSFRRGQTPPDLAHMIPKSGPILERPPGAAMSYTNADYTLLGRAIETVSGQPYEVFIRRQLLEPLGMIDASVVLDDALRSKIAQGYLTEGPRRGPYLIDGTDTRPSGDLIATPEDMGNFLQMWLDDGRYGGHQVLPAAVIRMFMSDCLAGRAALAGWCLGPERDLHAGMTAYSHSGDHLSYEAQLIVAPSKGIAIWAGNNSDQLVSLEFADAFMAHFFPAAWSLPRLPPARAKRGLTAAVQGVYRRDPSSLGRSARFFELVRPGVQFKVSAAGPNGVVVDGVRYAAIGPDLFQIADDRAAQDLLTELRYGFQIAFSAASGGGRTLFLDHGSATRIPVWDQARTVLGALGSGLLVLIAGSGWLLFRAGARPHVLLGLVVGLLWIAALPLMIWSLFDYGHEILFGWPPLFIAGEWLIVAALALTLAQVALTARALVNRERSASWALAPACAALLVALIAMVWEFTPTLFKL